MKKSAKLIILILMTMAILFSCDGSLTILDGDEDNHVNLNLLPYLNFKINEDGTVSASASVTSGAALSHVEIPGQVVLDGKTYTVSTFTGFDRPEDAAAIKHLMIDINVKISPEAYTSMENLEKITYKGTLRTEEGEEPTTPTWPELPSLPHTETEHFIGWYAGDQKITPGDPIDPNNAIPKARFKAHSIEEGWKQDETHHWQTCSVCDHKIGYADHSFTEWKADTDPDKGKEHRHCTVCGLEETQDHEHRLEHIVKAPTCTADGIKEHWQCASCGRYFLKSDATTEEIKKEDTVIDALGHLLSNDAEYDANDTHHWYNCERAGCNAQLYRDENKVVQEGELLHVLEFTYEYTASTNTLNISSTCTDCGHVTTEQTSSSTGMFEIVTAQGMTATKDGGNWVVSVADSYSGKYETCRWTDRNGDPIAIDENTKIENTGSTLTIGSAKIGKDGFMIMCYLYNSVGKGIDIVFVKING